LALGSAIVVMSATPVAGSSAHPHATAAAPSARVQADVAPPAGTELAHFNTDVGHYVQADNGNVHLQLYNGPAGLPSQSGWRFRDTHLGVPSAGKITPAVLPFGLHLAPTLNGSALASFTSEDKVTLGVGLAAVNSASPAAVTGQVGDEAITYTAPVASSPADLALRPTASGLDARIVLHKSSDGSTFTFPLTLDRRTRLDQLADGTIRVVRPITVSGNDGSTDVITQAEYFLQRPIARDSSADPVAAVQTGPATATLTTDASGQQSVVVTIDPAWLQDPRRAYPVHIDLPIVTSTALAYTGRFGTVNSCAPDVPSPLTAVVVGTEGGCTYNGQAYFNTSSILHDTPIVSATLRLYTPDTTKPTGVQIQPNVPVTASDPLTTSIIAPAQQVSWNSAPAVVLNAAGASESASEGHWHSWDVTSLVQQWVNDSKVNNGVTLVNAGAPVLFASPFGVGMNKLGEAPYLDITYGPRPSIDPRYMDHRPSVSSTAGVSPHISGVSPHISSPRVAPRLSDSASTIYGVSGSFSSDTVCGAYSCSAGAINEATVAGVGGGPLGGSYIRISVYLKCSGLTSPTHSYWASTAANNGNNPDIPTVIQRAGVLGLVPIITFLPAPGCHIMPLQFWSSETAQFVNDELINDYPAGTGGSVYFEIGNEVNLNDSGFADNPSANNWTWYAGAFANAAAALNNALRQKGYASYHIITEGMAAPTASPLQSQCSDGSNFANNNYNNINIASQAIADAANKGVPLSVLAAGVHPYHYNTPNNGTYWRNYYTEYPGYTGDGIFTYNTYAGPCGGLSQMLNTWLNSLSGEPVIFTEDNWTQNTSATPDCGSEPGCEGTYLVDLFTYLKDSASYYTNPQASSIRVMVYRGADDGSGTHQLGIYTPGGASKQIHLNVCNNSGSAPLLMMWGVGEGSATCGAVGAAWGTTRVGAAA